MRYEATHRAIDVDNTFGKYPYIHSNDLEQLELATLIQTVPLEIPTKCNWLNDSEQRKKISISIVGENHLCPNSFLESALIEKKFREASAMVFSEGLVFPDPKYGNFVDLNFFTDYYTSSLGIESPAYALTLFLGTAIERGKYYSDPKKTSDLFFRSLFEFPPSVLWRTSKYFNLDHVYADVWTAYKTLIELRVQNKDFGFNKNYAKEFFALKTKIQNLNETDRFKLLSIFYLVSKFALLDVLPNDFKEVPIDLLKVLLKDFQSKEKNMEYDPFFVTFRNLAWTKNIIQSLCEMPHAELAREMYVTAGIAHAPGLMARLKKILPEAHVEIVDNYKKFSAMDEEARVKAIEEALKQLEQ